jgi:hypothetical protein
MPLRVLLELFPLFTLAVSDGLVPLERCVIGEATGKLAYSFKTGGCLGSEAG